MFNSTKKSTSQKSTAKPDWQLVGNLTAVNGEYREDVAVIFLDDKGHSLVGKRGTQFEGVRFYINLNPGTEAMTIEPRAKKQA